MACGNLKNILVPLKIDLQISTSAMDDYLIKLIETARGFIATEGITLTDDISDAMLVEMYAAFLYRHRRENVPMPRYLRWALNNRLMHEKAGDTDG